MLMRTLLLSVGVLVIAAPTFADPFEILILSSHYRTELYTRSVLFGEEPADDRPIVEERAAQTALTPLNEFLQGTSAEVFAAATADLFRVRTETSALYSFEASARAEALAETILTFSPTQDGNAPIGIEVIGASPNSNFSHGLLSLYDVTADVLLWSYGWETNGRNSTVPFEGFCCYHAVMDLTTALLASHQYRYTTQVGSDASTDSQSIEMTTTGLHPVPEPTTLLLTSLGLTGFAIVRRRTSGRTRR